MLKNARRVRQAARRGDTLHRVIAPARQRGMIVVRIGGEEFETPGRMDDAKTLRWIERTAQGELDAPTTPQELRTKKQFRALADAAHVQRDDPVVARLIAELRDVVN